MKIRGDIQMKSTLQCKIHQAWSRQEGVKLEKFSKHEIHAI